MNSEIIRLSKISKKFVGTGKNIIAMIAKGTCPKTIAATATALSGWFLTIPFQTACITVAKRTRKKTWLSIDN